MTHFLAQTIPLPGGSAKGPENFLFTPSGGLGAIINPTIKIVIGLAGLGLLLMIISAGYTLMTSAGDAKKMEEGKQRLTFAIVGFLIVFCAYWLVQILGIMFGNTITSGFQ